MSSTKTWLKNIENFAGWGWLSGLSAGLQTKGSDFPIWDHAWVAGQVPSRSV